MTNISIFGVFFVFYVALTTTGTLSASEVCRNNLQKLAVANNELAFNLNRKLVAGSSENVFFSPVSISVVLGMLFYGTRGSTAQELRKVLGYDKADLATNLVPKTFNSYLSQVLKNGDSSDDYVLNIANAVVADERVDLLERYRENVQNLFKAVVTDVDFANDAARIVEEINDWVKEETHGKIEKLIDQLSPATVLVLLNAVYFKGTWKTQFEPRKTMDDVFYNNGDTERSVQMMHTTSEFPYAFSEDFQALELPYKGDNVSMLVLLPNQMDGLQALEESLTPEKLSDVQQSLHKTKVDVSLPKFKLQYQKELSPQMKALGAKEIFNPDAADFSGMTDECDVMVSQIIHKAVIEVNEEGSEAAAATGVVTVLASAVISNPEFRADHPFLFAIVEKGSSSNMILFLGRVNNL